MANIVKTLIAKITADTKGLEKGTKKAQKTVGSLGKTVAGAAFAGAIVVGIQKAVDAFAEFEEKMGAVQTLLSGDAKRTIEGFTEDILQLSREIPLAATDMADALFDVVSAGIPAGEAIGFLAEASKLAVAGVTDAKTAVDGMTSAYNAFAQEGLTATQIADKFFAAQVRGKTTIAELSASIGKVAPTAAAMNITLDETLGVISSLTLKGIRTAEAVTGFKAALSNIIKPSEKASQLAERLGIDFSEAGLKAKGFTRFMYDLKTAADKQGISMTELFGSVEAVNTVLAITGDNMETVKDITDDVTNSTGKANKAFKEQNKVLKNRFKITKNIFTAIGIGLVEIAQPIIEVGLAIINFIMTPIQAAVEVIAIFADTVSQLFNQIGLSVAIVGLKIKNIWSDTTKEITKLEKKRDDDFNNYMKNKEDSEARVADLIFKIKQKAAAGEEEARKKKLAAEEEAAAEEKRIAAEKAEAAVAIAKKKQKTLQDIINSLTAAEIKAEEERLSATLTSAKSAQEAGENLAKALLESTKNALIKTLFAEEIATMAKLSLALAVAIGTFNFPAIGAAFSQLAVVGGITAAKIGAIRAIGLKEGGQFENRGVNQFNVTKPTMIAPGVVAGDGTAERVTVEPLSKIRSNNNNGATMIETLNINIMESESPRNTADEVKTVIDDAFFVSNAGTNQSI